MLAYYAKRSGGEDFEKIQRPVDKGLWVDGNEITAEEIDQLAKTYNLARNVVYDVRDRQELPRVEFVDDDTYVFLRAPWLANSGHVATAPMLALARSDQFFTLGLKGTVLPETVAQIILPTTAANTTDWLLGVIATVVSDYQELLKHTERGINETAGRLRSHEVTNQDFVHFVVVEDNLNTYHMNLDGILAVVHRLRDADHPGLAESREALNDIALQIKQLLVAVDSYGGRVVSIKSAYSTIANNRLNQRMKTLTVLTVLITLPNVFYGMYGMNVVLPFAKEPWAYGAVVGFTIAITLTVYIVAKRLKVF